MKNYIIIVLGIFMIGCSSTEKEIIETFENGAVKIVLVDNGTELVKYEYYKSGSMRLEIPMIDSIKHGIYHLWYENGKLWATGRYKNGKRTDTIIEYYPNGNIRNKRFYVKDKMKVYRNFDTLGRKITEIDDLNHISLTWYPNGHLRSRIPTENGEYVRFYDNGRIQFSGNLEKGKEEGVYYYFTHKGDTIKTVTFKNGLVIDSLVWVNTVDNGGKVEKGDDTGGSESR